MIEQWFKYPSGEICRIRPTTPDGTGRPRVEMRYSNGDWAYVWPETAKGLCGFEPSLHTRPSGGRPVVGSNEYAFRHGGA